jgi:predicted CopG family antitoxin
VILLVGRVEGGPALLRGLVDKVGTMMFSSTVEEGFEKLRELIEVETAASSPSSEEMIDIPKDLIEEALVQSLTRV